MNAHEELINAFYSAFQKKDAEAMVACYHPDITFSDPVFQELKGVHAGNMWRMLSSRGSDLAVEYRDVRADDAKGSAHWEARYTFTTGSTGSTGRKVHNIIDAEFTFADGKIIRHTDRFSLSAWAGQALGLPGKLLGGTSFMQKKIRSMAQGRLAEFERSQ